MSSKSRNYHHQEDIEQALDLDKYKFPRVNKLEGGNTEALWKVGIAALVLISLGLFLDWSLQAIFPSIPELSLLFEYM